MNDIKNREEKKRNNAFTMYIRGITVASKCERISASATLSPNMALAKQRKSSMNRGNLLEVKRLLLDVKRCMKVRCLFL